LLLAASAAEEAALGGELVLLELALVDDGAGDIRVHHREFPSTLGVSGTAGCSIGLAAAGAVDAVRVR